MIDKLRILYNFALLMLIAGSCVGCKNSQAYEFIFGSNASGNNEIYRIDDDGRNVVRLTDTYLNEQDIIPSPNGHIIIFDYGGVRLERDIFALDMAQGNISRLTTALAYDIPGSWSPSGNQIAFISDREGGYYRLFVMNPDGSDQKHIPLITDSTHSVYNPKWDPSGKYILYSAAQQTFSTVPLVPSLFVIDLSTLNAQRLTNDQIGPCEEGDWSPDGNWIVATCEDGIYIFQPDGTNIRNLTNGADLLNCQSPRWSPDGEWIAVKCNKKTESKYNIYIIKLDDSEIKSVTAELPENLYNLREISWTPNSRNLLFIASSPKADHIISSSIDGKNNQDIYSFNATLCCLSIINSK